MFETLFNFGGSRLFDEFRRLEREMDEIFGQWPWPAGIRSVSPGSFPATNVGATPDKVEVYLFVPGVDPKSLDINLQQNLLTVAGSRSVPGDENATYYRQERFSGDFRRVIALPDDVDPDRAEASCRDGILRISVLRREQAKPRQIEIK